MHKVPFDNGTLFLIINTNVMDILKSLKIDRLVIVALLATGLYACDASERREKTIDGPPTESYSATESDTVGGGGHSYTDRTDGTQGGSLPEHVTPRDYPQRKSGVESQPSGHSSPATGQNPGTGEGGQ
jgi:hypothetical protein